MKSGLRVTDETAAAAPIADVRAFLDDPHGRFCRRDIAQPF
ncbi:MAG TPA: hypothetical protein PKV56_11130 [Burkholderiaceae bacterium]|jgi:hypothetical protein|nr:hypothetical protein [Burkholderiaceae bacterium]